GVEFAEAGVGCGHGIGVLGGDGGGGADGGVAGCGDGGPGVDAGAGEQGCAEGSAFFGFEDFDGVVVDVGLDLAPERAARAATAEANFFYGNTELAEEGEGVLQGEGDAFEDGADVVGKGGRGVDAREGGAGVGVEVRGALAEEVGCPEEAVGAGRDVGGESGELVVGGERAVGVAGREGVAEVAEREAGAVGDAHDVPDAGRGVAEGVEAAFGVECGSGGGGEDNAGGADGRGDGAGREDAHADRACALVACASGDGRVGIEAGGGGAFGG